MSTYTSSLGLEKITPGSQAGLWGNTTNNTYDLIDQAITGITEIAFSGAGATYTLTDDNGAYNEARSAVLNVTGSATGSNTIIIPNKQKTYYVRNDTGQEVVVQTAVGTTPCPVGKDYNLPVFCDGNNNVFLAILAPGAGTLTVSGGGTGKTTFNAGGFIKSPGGTADLTASATVNAATEVSGVLPVANGGTGQSSLASGALVVGSGTGAVSGITPVGYNGYVLTSNGSSWYPAPSASAGVTSVSSNTIGVSPASGNVVITLSGSNVTQALGYTPYNSTNPAGYVTSSGSVNYATSAGTATSASAATTATNLSGGYVNATTGNFSGQVNFSGITISQAWNMTLTSSIFYSGGAVTLAVNGVYGFYFYSSGNAIATGTWQSTSDIRVKENIAPIGATLDKVMQLKPVEFSMKADKSSTANRYGLIAQDLEQVFPYVVDDTNTTIDDAENVKAVSYTEIIPILVKAIQELKAEVDALKAAK